MALLLIGFALWLAELIGLGAGPRASARPSRGRPTSTRCCACCRSSSSPPACVFAYSLPGLLWVGAVGAAVVARPAAAASSRGRRLPEGWVRRSAPYAAGLAVVARRSRRARVGPDLELHAGSRRSTPTASAPSSATCAQSLNPLEALGIWPSSEFDATCVLGEPARRPSSTSAPPSRSPRSSPGSSPRRERRRSRCRPRPWRRSPSGRCWRVVAQPLRRRQGRWRSPRRSSMAVVAARDARRRAGRCSRSASRSSLGAGLSSFLVLRSRRGRARRATPTSSRRSRARGRRARTVLFLGRDDFIGWELARLRRDHRRRHQLLRRRGRQAALQEGGGGRREVRRRRALPAPARPASDYVLATTRRPGLAGAAAVRGGRARRATTCSTSEPGATGKRRTLDEGTAVGARARLRRAAQPRARRGEGTAMIWDPTPVIGEADGWEPDDEPTDGSPVDADARASGGRPLADLARVRQPPAAPASALPSSTSTTTVAANLDFRGETPTFPVAEVEVDGRTEAEVDDRAGGAEPARPARCALPTRRTCARSRRRRSTRARSARVPKREMCGEYVDWYRERMSDVRRRRRRRRSRASPG